MKFRFVDKITAWSPYESISGLKAVSFEEYGLKDAFGEEPRLPESLLLESFLQLGNWLILLSSDFNEMGMVLRISQVQYEAHVKPGEVVRMEVEVVRQQEDGLELAGEGFCGERRVIAGAGCLAVPVSARDFFDPADLRVLFSEIYEPNR